MTPAQEALVLEHDAIARGAAFAMVRRGLPAFIGADDLLQAARVGLCEAALRWTPDRGVPFGAYARQRVHGAIIDSMRVGQPLADVGRQGWRKAWVHQLEALIDDTGFDVPVPFDEHVEHRILFDQVTRLSAQLPRSQRRAFDAAAVGVQNAELARLVGVSANAIGFARHRMVKRMRQLAQVA